MSFKFFDAFNNFVSTNFNEITQQQNSPFLLSWVISKRRRLRQVCKCNFDIILGNLHEYFWVRFLIIPHPLQFFFVQPRWEFKCALLQTFHFKGSPERNFSDRIYPEWPKLAFYAIHSTD